MAANLAIAAVSTDRSKILYAMPLGFLIVDTVSGKVTETRPTGRNTTNMSQVASLGANGRWQWTGKALTQSTQQTLSQWNDKCPLCNKGVTLTPTSRDGAHVLLTHNASGFNQCAIQTRSNNPDTICDQCQHPISDHGAVGCLCGCYKYHTETLIPVPDNPPVQPPVHDENMLRDLMELTRRVDSLESAVRLNSFGQRVLELTTRVDSHDTQFATVDNRLSDLEKRRPIEIHIPNRAVHTLPESAHPILPLVIALLAAGENVYLYGDAGSGKTTIMKHAADALGIPAFIKSMSIDDSAGSLIGRANPLVIGDAPRWLTGIAEKPYRDGGLLGIDEIAAADASCTIALNALLANGHMMFDPNNPEVCKHDLFGCIAADNTVGTGATIKFIGRNPLDAATLDRFIRVKVEYDEPSEATWAHAETPNQIRMVKLVQEFRHELKRRDIHALCTPRASIRLCKFADNPELRSILIRTVLCVDLTPTDAKSVLETAARNANVSEWID